MRQDKVLDLSIISIEHKRALFVYYDDDIVWWHHQNFCCKKTSQVEPLKYFYASFTRLIFLQEDNVQYDKEL